MIETLARIQTVSNSARDLVHQHENGETLSEQDLVNEVRILVNMIDVLLDLVKQPKEKIGENFYD